MTPNPSTTSHPPAWGKPWIISSSVAVFCTLILIITNYKLLRRLCLRLFSASPSRNANQRRRILNQVNQDALSLQFQSHGLNFYVIRSLPVTQFKKDEAEAAEDNPSSNIGCAICLGEFEDGDWLKHLPKCSHAFHISCIETWFECHSNCPLCRSQVYGFMHAFPVPTEPTLEIIECR